MPKKQPANNPQETNNASLVCKLEPPKREDYKELVKRIPTPTTPLEYARYELRTEALWRKYSISFSLKENVALTVNVQDGRKKTNIITLFKGGVTQCTCAGFLRNEINFCEHIAALQNTIEFGRDNEWIAEFKATASLLKFANVTYFDTYQKDIKTREQSQAVANCKTELAISMEAIKQKLEEEAKLQNSQNENCFVSCLENGLKLFDYQEKIFSGILSKKRAICSMIMGSGKTLTSIACYKWLKDNKDENLKCLVVCPKSLKKQWQQEFQRACGVSAYTIDSAKTILASKNENVKIITYNLFSRIIDDLLKQTAKFDLVIFDEIQFIRNSETNVWKAANKIETEYFIGLSGTVIENRLDDLYSIMEIVEPGKLGPKWRFSQDFQELLAVTRTGCVFRGLKNETKLKEIIKDRVFGYDNLKLPEIQYKTIVTTMSKEQKNMHDNYLQQAEILKAKALTKGLSFVEKSMLQSFLLKARQACNDIELINKKKQSESSEKVSQVVNLIKDYALNNEKVVVFTQWTEFMEIIIRSLEKNNIGFVKYTGAETEQQRKQNLIKFQQNAEIIVFFATDSGGVGLDGLQNVSRNVIHVEPPWNPAKIDQRNARVHRIGQTKPVTITTFYCQDSIEEKIMVSLDTKREIRATVFAVED